LIRNKVLTLHRFAVLTAVATLALVSLGGLVTSHGVGMAVPDWPNTYGYNMFFFPISQWVGGIFYEHTHRLLASTVGLLTSILALWLYGTKARPFMRWMGLFLLALAIATIVVVPKHAADAFVLMLTGAALACTSLTWPQGEPSSKWLRRFGLPKRAVDNIDLAATRLVLAGACLTWPRCEPAPKWLRRLGLAAFFAVVFQGVLGGLRVVWIKDQIGIFHAALAQLFFALTCSIALFTSRWWEEREPKTERRNPEQGRISDLLIPFATFLILVQLILGATMRHQHAGLSIPDFPLAYGKLWPATDPASVAQYNQHRLEITDANPITAFQITLQMLHRLMAGVILVAVACCAWVSRKIISIRALTLAWLVLILTQAFLGAATIWSNKAADIATAHVVVGALSLALGTLISIISFRPAMAFVSTQTSRDVEPISLNITRSAPRPSLSPQIPEPVPRLLNPR
jgi:cytochrome c oxidase assembly protein subunit 15